MKKKIAIAGNQHTASKNISALLRRKLEAAGYEVSVGDAAGAELIICIGGDGSFLHALHRFGFPETPFVGINTGHLGFFQELDETDIDVFLDKYARGDYTRQEYRTVEGIVEHAKGSMEVKGLNEIIVRGAGSRLCHLELYIGDRFIERFSGDGIVVSTPAGSTAYNYALRGSIVDPRLALLQVTPIAAVNNAAYRSFTSGILLPPDLSVGIFPVPPVGKPERHETRIAVDGVETYLRGVKQIRIRLSEKKVSLLRFKDYYFWNTVKEKLLQP
jgi:NAD+ kinase